MTIDGMYTFACTKPETHFEHVSYLDSFGFGIENATTATETQQHQPKHQHGQAKGGGDQGRS